MYAREHGQFRLDSAKQRAWMNTMHAFASIVSTEKKQTEKGGARIVVVITTGYTTAR